MDARIVAAAAVLLIAVAVIMKWRAPLAGKVQPIAFEMERDGTVLQSVLDAAGRPAVERNTKYDLYGLIPAYTLFLVLFALSAKSPRLAWAAAAFALLTGICDVLEDFAILRVLPIASPNEADAMRIVIPAFAKWIALFVTVGLIAITATAAWLRVLLLIVAAAGVIATFLFSLTAIGISFIAAFGILLVWSFIRPFLS